MITCGIFLIAVVLGPQLLHSQGAADRGQTTAGFLKLGVDARSIAMGEAASALATGASALYWNPSALGLVKNRSASLMHAAYLASSFYDYAAFAQKKGDKSVLGCAVQYFSAGEIIRTDELGIERGDFNPNGTVVSLGYARRLGSFHAGVALKSIRLTINSSAHAAAIDAGVLSEPILGGMIRGGATISNIGTAMKFNDEGESLPTLAKAGIAFSPAGRAALFSLDIGFPNDNEPFVAIGGEWQMAMMDRQEAAFRLGYNTKTTVGGDMFSGVAAGFGWTYGAVGLDYAYVPFGSVSATHRFSLTHNFR